MRLLTTEDLKRTFDHEPVRLGDDAVPPFDFWAYAAEVPAADLDGHDFSEGVVEYVWDMPKKGFQHVLVRCGEPDVYLVLVLDTRRNEVYGHSLMNLRALYGLK